MFQQIKAILVQIQNFKLRDKVTQFNRLKNNQNKNESNITEGQLMSILRNFKHFQFIQNLYGSAYLLSIGSLIDPYMIRKNKILIRTKQTNSYMDFVVTDGIIKVQKLQKGQTIINIQSFSGQLQTVEKFTFQKYISDGTFFTLIEYPQNQYKLTSHSDSKLLRFPSKSDLDPMQLLKKNQQTVRQMEKYQQFDHIRKLLHEFFRKDSCAISNFGLGSYDYNQLLSHMKLQRYAAKETIINQNSVIDRIGFLYSGKLIQEDKSKQKIKFVSKSNMILTLYKQDFTEEAKKLTTDQVVIQHPQFIGISDYVKQLEENPFKIQEFQQYIDEQGQKKFRFGTHKFDIISSKQYWCFQESQIIWIPIEIFALKFNNQTLLELVNQWKAKLQLKRQQMQKQKFLMQIKNPKIQKFAFQQQKADGAKHIQIFPKVNHHQLVEIQQRGMMQSKVMAQKQKRLQKYKKRKNFQLQQNSLLGVTMRKYPTIEQLQERFNVNQKGKQFSRKKQTYEQMITRKKLQTGSINKSTLVVQQMKTLPLANFKFQEQQPIIMYPQKYKTSSLSPKLKKSLKQAEKQKNLFFNKKFSQQKYKHRNCKNLSSNQSLDSLLFSNQTQNNGLSTIQSRKSLSSSKVSIDNPEQIYMGMIEKIAYKYSSLEQLLNSYQKKGKKASPIKQRILQMKILEQKAKKKHEKPQQKLQKNKNSQQVKSYGLCKFPSLLSQ